MTSENVLIRFENEKLDETNFNEENIRNYFQTYGVIRNLYLLKNNRCVIEFQDYGKFEIRSINVEIRSIIKRFG